MGTNYTGKDVEVSEFCQQKISEKTGISISKGILGSIYVGPNFTNQLHEALELSQMDTENIRDDEGPYRSILSQDSNDLYLPPKDTEKEKNVQESHQFKS